MHGCWAVMLAFSHALPLDFDGAFVHNSSLGWIARNSSKPDRRQNAETWVLHASPEWSAEHLDTLRIRSSPFLLEEFWRSTGLAPARPTTSRPTVGVSHCRHSRSRTVACLTVKCRQSLAVTSYRGVTACSRGDVIQHSKSLLFEIWEIE